MLTQTSARPTLLIMAMFGLQPVAMGGWFALIPFVQDKLDLSKSALAIALLGMSIGTVLTLQFAGRLVDTIGPRKIYMVLLPVQAGISLLPLAAPTQMTLFASLFVLGSAIAFLEVALNLYAGRLERSLGRLIMNRCHGFWSLGLGAGSLFVTLLIARMSPSAALGFVVSVSVVAGVLAAMALPKIEGTNPSSMPARRKLKDVPPTVPLIALVLIWVTMTEGAMADWSAVYMSEILPRGATGAGFAVTLYAAFITLGRFLGDAVNRMAGPVRLARMTIGLAIVGIVILAIPVSPPIAYLGFALVGLGVSTTFPLGMSAVSGLQPAYQAANISIVTTIAIMGFLVGPPMIGFLADAIHLRAGIAALIPGLLVSFWLAGSLNHGNLGESESDRL